MLEPTDTFASEARRSSAARTGTPSRRSGASARFDIVISTLRRPTLSQLLLALDTCRGPAPERVIVVDDRPRPAEARSLPAFRGALRDRVQVLSSGGLGPAVARNLGWRAGSAPWVVFIDDDLVPPHEWLSRLHSDLSQLDEKVAGSRGRVRVPDPTALERNVIGLESAGWLGADMAYRRSALEALGGFDEGFLRAYRDDAELARRALSSGYGLSRGRRHSHRSGRDRAWLSRASASEDLRSAALHRIEWKRAVAASGGRFPRHVAVTTAALATGVGLLASSAPLAWLGGAAWIAGTADIALARMPAGPCTPRAAATLLASSLLIPPLDVFERVRVQLRNAWRALRVELAGRRWFQRLQARALDLAARLRARSSDSARELTSVAGAVRFEESA